VLIRRENPPFQGCYALPGGFVEVGETVEEAVAREAKEETGLEIEVLGLVGIYSDPGRDPGSVWSRLPFWPGAGAIWPLDRMPDQQRSFRFRACRPWLSITIK